jgi:methionine sulfoxide reductase heme-binding subunit
MAGGVRPETRGPPPDRHDRSTPRVERHPSPAGRRRTPHPARRLVGPAVVVLVLVPAVLIALRAVRGDLGTDPVETLQQLTGIWALRFLLLTLAVTPLRRLLGWSWLVKPRRTLGLAAFGYATAHLLVYVLLDQGLALDFIVEDVIEHPWVTIGMATWLMLLPLAVTSTAGWVRRLGGRRWSRLHQLVYACAIGGALHYTLAVKKDITLPVLYLVIVALLLGYRLALRLRAKGGSRLPAPAS